MIPFSAHPGLSKGIRTVRGVGPQIEKTFKDRGILVLGDLAGLMPLRYQDRRSATPIAELVEDLEVMVAGKVKSAKEGRFPKTGRQYFEIVLHDGTGDITALWFSFPSHLRYTLKQGKRVLLHGRTQRYPHKHKDLLQLVHPEITKLETGPLPPPEIRPVYPELADIKPGVLRRIMAGVRDELEGQPAVFPLSWLKKHDLVDPLESVRILHRPPLESKGALPRPEQSLAYRNLAFFELLFLQISLIRSKNAQYRKGGWAFPFQADLAEKFLQDLPFRLTDSQEKVWDEIRRDMASTHPMNRLLQGDVGSGKTVVALAAMMTAVDGGAQAALMAPTEILARQHFHSILPYIERLGVSARLLTGSLAEKEKKAIHAELADGSIQIVVGTHALISDHVTFDNLGLVVVDEQHRFGVGQRLALRAKADQPDILVMTATPIPRSMSLTLYGDLDLSLIEGLPPGRIPVETSVFPAGDRKGAYDKLVKEIENGGQAYVVAPRIDAEEEVGEEKTSWASAESLFEYVRDQVLPGEKTAMIHGRMNSEEQQRIMEAFQAGVIKVLVATTVIEVGVDVPNATVMLIEGADRFGLAQLHQLRGRVGRGDKPGECLLVATHEETDRLRLVANSNDGFKLAEEDLKQRGPGDWMGVKQSGLPALNWARLPQDLGLLLKARKYALRLIDEDPDLADPAMKIVRLFIDRLDQIIQVELADVG